MAGNDAAFQVDLRTNLQQFERQMRQQQNAADAKLRQIERRFDRANKKTTAGFTAKGGLNSVLNDARMGVMGLSGSVPILGGSLGKLGVAGLAAGAAVGAMAVAMNKAKAAMNWADDLVTAADNIGVTAEALQELRYAAEATDVGTAQLEKGLRNLNASLGAVQSGIRDGRYRKVFEALGFSREDLAQFKDGADLLPVLAERIKNLDSQAKQVNMAKALGMEELLLLLQSGEAGIEDLTKAYRDMGGVIDEELVREAAALNEVLRKNDDIISQNLNRAYLNLAPLVSGTSEAMADLAKWAGDITTGFGDMAAGIEDFARRHKNAIASLAERSLSVLPGLGTTAGDIAGRMIRRMGTKETADATAKVGGGSGSGAPDLPVEVAGGGGAAGDAAKRKLDRDRAIEDAIHAAKVATLAEHDTEHRTLDERLGFALDRLALEKEARDRELERAVADGKFTKAQVQTIAAAEEEAWLAKERNVRDEAALDAKDAEARNSEEMARMSIEFLAIQLSAARTAKERRDLELKLLEDTRKIERQRLESDLGRNKELTEGQRQGQLEAFDRNTGAMRGDVEDRTKGPMAEWLDSAILSAAEYDEALERIAVNGLDSVTSGIADAIAGTQEWGDVFKQVAAQMMAEMVRLAVKQAMLRAAGGQGSGGQGLGGLLSAGLALFGGGGGGNFSGNGTIPSSVNFAGQYADGGRIRGPGTGTSDSILGWLSDGEYVVRAKATKKHFRLLEAINSDRLPAFAAGGRVGSSSGGASVGLGGVQINNYGPPTNAEVTRRPNGDMQIDLMPQIADKMAIRAGASGALARGSRLTPRPKMTA